MKKYTEQHGPGAVLWTSISGFSASIEQYLVDNGVQGVAHFSRKQDKAATKSTSSTISTSEPGYYQYSRPVPRYDMARGLHSHAQQSYSALQFEIFSNSLSLPVNSSSPQLMIPEFANDASSMGGYHRSIKAPPSSSSSLLASSFMHPSHPRSRRHRGANIFGSNMTLDDDSLFDKESIFDLPSPLLSQELKTITLKVKLPSNATIKIEMNENHTVADIQALLYEHLHNGHTYVLKAGRPPRPLPHQEVLGSELNRELLTLEIVNALF